MNLNADLDAAVEANILSHEQRERLSDFMQQRAASHEEKTRQSFNDAFVSIAPALLLLAGGALAVRFSR